MTDYNSKEPTAVTYLYETLIYMYPTIKDVFDKSYIARGFLQEARNKEEEQLEKMFDCGFDVGLDYKENMDKHDGDDEAFTHTDFREVFKKEFTTEYKIED